MVLKSTSAIHEVIKKIIEDMLEDDADQTPKIILVKLIKLRKEHNLFPKEILPSFQLVIYLTLTFHTIFLRNLMCVETIFH